MVLKHLHVNFFFVIFPVPPPTSFSPVERTCGYSSYVSFNWKQQEVDYDLLVSRPQREPALLAVIWSMLGFLHQVVSCYITTLCFWPSMPLIPISWLIILWGLCLKMSHSDAPACSFCMVGRRGHRRWGSHPCLGAGPHSNCPKRSLDFWSFYRKGILWPPEVKHPVFHWCQRFLRKAELELIMQLLTYLVHCPLWASENMSLCIKASLW